MDSDSAQESVTVYVELLGEGVEVYRPTQAKRVSKSSYLLLPTKDYDHELEDWKFKPGSIVTCAEKNLSGGKYLVADELAEI